MELRTFSREKYIRESHISNYFSLAPVSYCILRMLFLCRLVYTNTDDKQCRMATRKTPSQRRTVLRNLEADISCYGNENHTIET